MSVWNTVSASFHLVQEKLEKVLEDSALEEVGEEKQVTLRERLGWGAGMGWRLWCL